MMIPESPFVRGIVQHMPTDTSVVPSVVHARDHTHAHAPRSLSEE
jgi:hypothetical protein